MKGISLTDKEKRIIERVDPDAYRRVMDLFEIRMQHEWTPGMNTGRWSKKALIKWAKKSGNGFWVNTENGSGKINKDGILDHIVGKFPWLDAKWGKEEISSKSGKGKVQVVYSTKNFPTIGGVGDILTLADMVLIPSALADEPLSPYMTKDGEPFDRPNVLNEISKTGIGYAGVKGVAWNPLTDIMGLPGAVLDEAAILGRGIFKFYDAIEKAWLIDEEVRAILDFKKPARIQPIVSGPGSMNFFRMDLVIDKKGKVYCTESESAPGGPGFMHAIAQGHGVNDDMLDYFAQRFKSKRFIVMLTTDWIDYIWDMGVFVKALQERGIEAEIWIDQPLDRVQAHVAKSWLPKSCHHVAYAKRCDTDFLGRLHELGWQNFVKGLRDSEFPDNLENETEVFRCGYHDNFNPAVIRKMQSWCKGGATIINGLSYFYEHKGIFALLKNKTVRSFIDSFWLDVLDKGIPETKILTPLTPSMGKARFFKSTKKLVNSFVSRFAGTKLGDFFAECASRLPIPEFQKLSDYFTSPEEAMSGVSKFAGFDHQNECWGARSVMMSIWCGADKWRKQLEALARLSWPVIVQTLRKSKKYKISYVDDNERVKVLDKARIRLNIFCARDENDNVFISRGLVTGREKTFRIHGASDAGMGFVREI